MAELSTIARPYAKAAFEYAADASALGAWSSGLAQAAAATKQPKLLEFLRSPSVTAVQQADTLNEVCGDEISDTIKSFIIVLSDNHRLTLLPQISNQFDVMKANFEKAVDVEVISAQPLDSDQQKLLSEALSKKLEREVNMQVSLDKDLLGGAVIRAGDTVIDGSIRGRLTKLAESFNS